MAVDVGYLSAVGAGALSFLSPCVLPLVPPYLCYMAGVTVDDFREGRAAPAAQRSALAKASLAFVLGFSTVFVLLGLTASAFGRLLLAYKYELGFVSGAIIMLMGLNFLGVLRIPFLSREARFQTEGKPASLFASYIMGLAFAFGWTPCIGPVLSPILTLAAGRGTLGEGAAMLAAYSLGLGIPFLAAAFFSGAFMRFLGRFKVHLGRVEKIMGVLLILAGIAFMTGGVQTVSYWLLENFPVLGRLG
ncbi:cytochrome c biogenesis protein CcdA [Tianweitania sp. BSSL-BM11]|uniref:Cytochrome c biogenesis protein CcdA n=1 Tax=Tianweitania aestuarii TaxID=2814886 RepID=A0ABS5RTQ5_9HYPH|nr:cytochrome c biogenesis CcdA family protein [Tianweitania aestuarii]MBS9720443.1 cytochrome c biogenesis protein CcdA [Tianweitania aestuarii]